MWSGGFCVHPPFRGIVQKHPKPRLFRMGISPVFLVAASHKHICIFRRQVYREKSPSHLGYSAENVGDSQ